MTDQHKHKSEMKRDVERFPLDFLVEITGLSPAGESFSDCGKMNNVSGSGLCFSTAHAQWYAVGDKLHIQVFLPGTDTLNASMASDASVAWIRDPLQQKRGKLEEILIGITMHGCMAFETRDLRQPEGSS